MAYLSNLERLKAHIIAGLASVLDGTEVYELLVATDAHLPSEPTRVTGATATIVASEADQYVLVDSVPTTLTLPAIEAGMGLIYVKDRTGLASPGDPITLSPTSATIDGEATLAIDGGYAAVALYPDVDAGEWSIL